MGIAKWKFWGRAEPRKGLIRARMSKIRHKYKGYGVLMYLHCSEYKLWEFRPWPWGLKKPLVPGAGVFRSALELPLKKLYGKPF